MSIPVTFRVSAEVRDQLETLRNDSGASLGEILRTMLLRRKTDEIVNAAYHRGWGDGHAEGLQAGRKEGESSARNTLRLNCPKCEKPMIINLSNDNWRVWRDLIRTDVIGRWRHTSCAEE